MQETLQSKSKLKLKQNPLGAGLKMVCGWAARIRTLIAGTKNQSPAIGRQPSLLLLYSPHEISGKSSECDYSVFLLLLKSRNPSMLRETYDIHEISFMLSPEESLYESYVG